MNTIRKNQICFLAPMGWCGVLTSLLLILTPAIGYTKNADLHRTDNITRLDSLSLPFVTNAGQIDPRVRFYAQTFAGNTYVTNKGEIVYSLPPSDNKPAWTLIERFEHGKTTPAGINANTSRVSYIKDQNGTVVTHNASTFGGVNLGEVFPGVQVELRAHGRNVEKIYTVAPGSDAARIRMGITGSKSLNLDRNGNLIADTGNGPVSFSTPVAWQSKDGRRVPVNVGYALQSEHQYGFKVEKYDKSKELIIDPILQSTYLGGSSTDDATAMAIHPVSGEVYVVGYTYSSNFPGVSGGADISCGQCSPSTEVFVARFSSDLKTLLSATYLGGSQYDEGRAIAIHPVTGDVYVTGKTDSSDFPGIAGGADNNFVYPWDITEIFVSRLSADLTTLKQSTYIGGNAIDEGTAISIHPQSGDVYVAGNTSSDNFPGITTSSADASCATAPLACSGYSPQQEGFIARLSSDLKAIYQSTYLGGTGNDAINALTIHPLSGDIYVTGQTRAPDFPYISGGADINCQNCTRSGDPYFWEGFITRLSSSLLNDGNVQSTYLGGRASDIGYAIAVHPANGDIYAGGLTTSYDFPATAGGADAKCEGLSCFEPPSTGGGRFEGFISRLSSDLEAYAIKQSTYLGGVTDDVVVSLAIDPDSGDIYAAGSTDSRDFPGINGGADITIVGQEAFVSQLKSDLKNIIQSSYLGGSGTEDNSRSMAIHPYTGDVYVAGMTTSTDFPKVSGGADETCTNCSDFYPPNTDAFISMLDNLSNQQRYYLTVTTAGAGAVSSSPAGIGCGSDCLENYVSGTVVTLTATPTSGSAFTGWAGACSGIGICTVTMSQNNAVTATFSTIPNYGLTVSKAGTGAGTITSSPPGIDCGSGCLEDYANGTAVTLTATPANGSTFTGWGGACSGTGICSVTLSAAVNVTANFAVNQTNYSLTASKAGTGAGTITSNPPGIDCGGDCLENYANGTTVTLTATPAGGSAFTGWGGACSGTGICSVTLSAAVNVTANFAVNQTNYSLTASKAGTGAGTITSNPPGIDCGGDCLENYANGTTVTLTATPAGGSAFTGWGGACSGTGVCSVTLSSAANVTANFTVNQTPGANTECLLNWAEGNYPALFAPSGSATAILGVYTYRYYWATNSYLGVSSTDNHVYYMGADGKLLDEGPLSDWLPKAGCQPPPPSDCLFNWAENNYPGLFAPSGSATAISGVYTYRYYWVTNAYLGVSSTDNHVYYMGTDGILQNEGPLSDWLPKAGCQ